MWGSWHLHINVYKDAVVSIHLANRILYPMNLKFRCGSLDWGFVTGWMDGQCQSLAIRNLITSSEIEEGRRQKSDNNNNNKKQQLLVEALVRGTNE